MSKALILGASGMVGSKLLNQLIESPKFKSITCVGRRELDISNDKVKQVIVDFDNLKPEEFTGDHDVMFITMGTTRALAGSAERFIQVDHDYPLNAAKLFRENGGKTLCLLTSSGSNAKSWFLYPRTKGLLENDCKQLNFDFFGIFRPGLLLLEGEKRKDARLLERVLSIMFGPLGMMCSPISRVATAMRLFAEKPNEKFKIFENSDILQNSQ